MQNWVTSWISEKFSFNVHEKMSRWGGWQWRSLKKKTLNYLFYKGVKLCFLTKTCTNGNHESSKSHALLFLQFRTFSNGYWLFFPNYSNTTHILWLLCIRILPTLQTGVCCGDVCVNMMWAAKTSPIVAAKSSTWAQYWYNFIYSKTGILNLFTNGGGLSICRSPNASWASFFFPSLP